MTAAEIYESMDASIERHKGIDFDVALRAVRVCVVR